MALDIHIGKTEREAAERDPEITLREIMHKYIFNQTKIIDGCSYLSKLNDYYVDVYYLNGDIHKLKNDLQLIYEFTNNEEVKSFIDSFIQLCIYATTKGYNIYCFSD